MVVLSYFNEREVNSLVGDCIKEARKKAGFTQEELGAAIGLSGVAIMRYEKGQREPNKTTIEKIATALGVNPTSLMNWDEWEELYNNDGCLSKESKLLEQIQDFYGKESIILLECFAELNELGKNKAISSISDLTEIKKYRKQKKAPTDCNQ